VRRAALPKKIRFYFVRTSQGFEEYFDCASKRHFTLILFLSVIIAFE